jgi:hypothetical protein
MTPTSTPMELGTKTNEDTTNLEPTPKQIIDTLFKERDQYQQSSSSQRSDINDIYSAYMGKMDEVKSTPYKSKESIPKLRTEIAYVVPFIFSGNPEIEVEGVGVEDKDIARVIEKIVSYRLDTIPQAYEKIESWVKQAVTFGTSLLKVCWKFETKKNEDGTEIPVKDEPDIEVPNILDCFYNPIIPEVESQISIIFRSVLNLEDVKNNPIYDFTDELGVLNRTKIAGKTKTSIDQYDSSRQASSDSIDLTKTAEGTIEVYERITRDRIQTVCDGQERLVLRDVENPYGGINSIKFIYEPNCIPNRFDGLGVGQNTLGLGKLYYKMMNQTLDNVALTNNPMFLFRKGAGIDARQLVAKPGGGIAVDAEGENLQSAIQPVLFPDIKQGAIEILRNIDDEHKRASGANDLVQGSASNKTLGQDQMASNYSSNRFELINRRFKQALADVAKMIIKMELKNIQSIDADILRIFPLEAELQNGEVMYSRETVYQMLISPEAQNAKYNIKVKGESNIAKNKDIQIKQLTDAYNLFGSILPPENQMEWARKILELRGVDEIDKLVPDPESFAEQQAMQQGAMNPEMLQQGMPQQPMV